MKKKIIPKVLCVIPAKKSSRKIKKKKKKIINGHPMIAWTINEAKKKKFPDLIVSTDEKIMKIAKGIWCIYSVQKTKQIIKVKH